VTALEILADADELAAHLWRVPERDHPAYKRAINRLLSLVTGVAVLGALVVSPLGGQQTHAKRDSVRADTLRRMVPYLSTGRDRKRLDSLWVALKQDAGTVDTVTVTKIVRDTVWLPRPDTTVPPPPVDTTTPPPPIIIPQPDTTILGTVFGASSVVSATANAALGGAYAKYETEFVTYDEQQWATNGANWATINYYDRAAIYYAWYRRTGDAKYLTRANAVAIDYRKNYLEASGYLPTPHWAMLDGVALHWLATKDTMSRLAIGKAGDMFTGLSYRDNIGRIGSTDNRIQARYLVALLLANAIKAPSVGIASGGIPGGHDWALELRRALPLILSTQDADGAWRLSDCGDGGPRAVHPFVMGLLLDALTRYHDQFEADPRILPAVKRGADYLWAADWVSTSNAFKYVERVCPSEGGPTPAPDLNNLILPAYAWLYARTGDATYRTRAVAIFTGAINGAWLSPTKQFNQVYSSSWRALAWMR
jgi:hypothetical protein